MNIENKLSLSNFNNINSGMNTGDQFDPKPVYGTYAYPSPREDQTLSNNNGNSSQVTINNSKEDQSLKMKKHKFIPDNG